MTATAEALAPGIWLIGGGSHHSVLVEFSDHLTLIEAPLNDVRTLAAIAKARETGVVKTMFGRRRLVPELTSRNGQVRAAAERVTVNMPIQGTAADILKRAMIDVHRALHHSFPKARMILTVHDELLFEAPSDQSEDVAALVRDKMSTAVHLAVPLDVDVGIGENWKDAKHIE